MEKKIKLPEKLLYEIWKNQKFTQALITKNGEEIQVIDAGIENTELAGPDFIHSRIKIGNLTYLGDIEIDGFYSDWKGHGHFLNKSFNKVILHVTLNSDSSNSFVYTQDGRKVHSVTIGAFIEENLRTSVQKAILAERKNRVNKMVCAEVNFRFNEREKLELLYRLGVERFNQKCEKMLNRLKEISYISGLKLKEPVIKYTLDENFYNYKFTHEDFYNKDIWLQLLYESVFEALGYSKNKEIMQRLAKACEIKFIEKYRHDKNFLLKLESILFHVAGLVPPVHSFNDEITSGYVKKIVELWQDVKDIYDGKTFHAAQWHFFKLRPQNFPTIRIAGGAVILERIINEKLFSQIIKTFETSGNHNTLLAALRNAFIVKADGFWKKHYVFDKPGSIELNYFIGLSRADEIIVNVVLPILSIYFDIFGKKEITKRVQKLFLNYYQKSDNSLVDEMAESLSVIDATKRSVLYQGMIQLFRNYCSKGRCKECVIGTKVFEDESQEN